MCMCWRTEPSSLSSVLRATHPAVYVTEMPRSCMCHLTSLVRIGGRLHSPFCGGLLRTGNLPWQHRVLLGYSNVLLLSRSLSLFDARVCCFAHVLSFLNFGLFREVDVLQSHHVCSQQQQCVHTEQERDWRAVRSHCHISHHLGGVPLYDVCTAKVAISRLFCGWW